MNFLRSGCRDGKPIPVFGNKDGLICEMVLAQS